MNFPPEDGKQSPAGETVVLRLYVAGSAPNSLRATANLKEICRQYLPNCRVEIINILADSTRALADGVMMTPTLIKVSPPPLVRLVGDLSQTTTVLRALGLEEPK